MTEKVMIFTDFKDLFSFQRYSSFKICMLAKLDQVLINFDEKEYIFPPICISSEILPD